MSEDLSRTLIEQLEIVRLFVIAYAHDKQAANVLGALSDIKVALTERPSEIFGNEGDLQKEILRLEGLVYVPGLWKCAKCKCTTVCTNLHVDTGGFSANNSPQQCPNACGPMWRVTERDAGNELIDRWEKEKPPKREMVPLKRALELLQEWHDLHFESNRTLDADDTATRTQKFLIETDIEVEETKP